MARPTPLRPPTSDRGDTPATADGRPLAIAVCGATGATGGMVVRAVAAADELRLSGALAAPDDPAQGQALAGGVVVTADPATAIAGADAVIDFSTPAAVEGLLAALAADPRPVVIGTTALPAETLAALEALATRVPALMAPNMSVGVHLLRALVRSAARTLGEGWDIEVVEVHHRRKLDAPSGTALALARDLAEATGCDGCGIELGRHGRGPRADGSIGVQAVRGGDVVGEHTVMLIGEGERLELIHRASDRGTFAAGAVRAARWLCEPGRPPGLYGMADVLG